MVMVEKDRRIKKTGLSVSIGRLFPAFKNRYLKWRTLTYKGVAHVQ
jgi:hypothetical protein